MDKAYTEDSTKLGAGTDKEFWVCTSHISTQPEVLQGR